MASCRSNKHTRYNTCNWNIKPHFPVVSHNKLSRVWCADVLQYLSTKHLPKLPSTFQPNRERFIYAYIHTYIYINIHTYIYTYIYTYMCVYIYIYTHMCMCVYICVCVCVCVCIYIYIYTKNWPRNCHSQHSFFEGHNPPASIFTRTLSCQAPSLFEIFSTPPIKDHPPSSRNFLVSGPLPPFPSSPPPKKTLQPAPLHKIVEMRLHPPPNSRDGQGKERFLAPSADKYNGIQWSWVQIPLKLTFYSLIQRILQWWISYVYIYIWFLITWRKFRLK